MTLPPSADNILSLSDRKTRLFVALTVPPAFCALVRDLPRKGIDAQWSHTDDLHLTLRFLGDLPPDAIPDLREELGRVRRPAFSVEVRGLGAFDNDRQSVLYARVDSTRKLTALCGDVTDALTPLGFDFGARPFVPHITLARLKKPAGLSKYIEIQEKNVNFRWQTKEFSLMRSATPDEKGRRYSLLASWPLIP